MTQPTTTSLQPAATTPILGDSKLHWSDHVMMGMWVTNLESTEALQSLLDNALALQRAQDGHTARAAVSRAKFLLADNKRALAALNQSHGPISFGEPMATPFRTADEIAADGIIGVYKQGAGSPDHN